MAYDLPITISEGDFSDPTTGVGTTPLGKIAVRFSEAVINTGWTLANSKSADASAKSDAIAAAIDAIIATPGDYHVTAGAVGVPTVTAPNVTIPASIDTAEIMATFGDKYVEIADFLADKFSHIIATYFPNDAADYAAAEAWLTDAIAGGGIPETVRQQVWGDDHARITLDKLRAQDAVIAQFAARRLPMPTAAAASAVMQIEQKAQDELAESSRKIAVLSIDNIKWAVEKVLNLRQLAINAAGDYAKTLGLAPNIASQVTGIGYDAQGKLISAAASFYGADTDAKEMMAKVAQFNETLALDAAAKNQSANLQLVEDKVKALLADLQSTMQQATALFNNLHASAGTTLSV